MQDERIPLIKLLPNRVRRNYRGGKTMDTLRGVPHPTDGEMPEEWLASTTRASNPGLPYVADEGLSAFLVDGGKRLLADTIDRDPAFYLGDPKAHSLAFLCKWLDSSMRLHTQVHPTREFARKYLNSGHGKFEAYYVLAVRGSIKHPAIRLGFQKQDITREKWTMIVQSQDMEAMDGCFEPIPVKEGDVVYIPGGVPHAIGEGIFLLEMLEPSDLVVRCEFNREGIVVPPPARFMNRGLEFCMGIFDYEAMSKEEVHKRFFLTPKTQEADGNYRNELLIGEDISPCFIAHRLTFAKSRKLWEKGEKYAVLACTKGSGTIETESVRYSVRILDSFFIPAGTHQLMVNPGPEGLELCMLQPIGTDDT